MNGTFYNENERSQESDLSWREMAPIITFYSGKGGIGKTTSLAFVAKILADQGKRVMVVDCNFQNPEVHYYLTSETPRAGVTEYLLREFLFEQENVDSEFCLPADPLIDPAGRIRIMPAGNIGELASHARVISRLNSNREEFRHSEIRGLFSKLHKQYEPDYFLVDTGAGISMLGLDFLLKYSTLVFYLISPEKPQKFMLEALSEKIRKAEQEIEYKWVLSFMERDSYAAKIQIDELYNDLREYIYLDGTKEYFAQLKESIAEYAIKHFDTLKKFKIGDLDKMHLQDQYLAMAKAILRLDKIEEPPLHLRVRIFEELNLTSIEGIGTAEYDTTTLNDFRSHFVLPPSARTILERNKMIILGRKGSGKSFLFTTLLESNEFLGLENSYNRKPMIGYNPIENTEDNRPHISIQISGDFWNELNSLQLDHQEKLPAENFWKRVWMTFLLYRLQKEDVGMIESIDMVEIWERQDVTALASYLLEFKNILQVENEIRRIDEQLKEHDHYQLILYDNLERIMNSRKEVRTQVIQSLALLWFDLRELRVRHLVPKLFIRTDIFDEMNFTNLSHKLPYILTIEWTNPLLWQVALKRLLSRSRTLRDYLAEAWEQVQKNNRGKFVSTAPLWTGAVDEGLGITINSSEAVLRFMVEQIFFERRESRKGASRKDREKSAFIYQWFFDRLRDGNDEVYPREFLSLLGKLYKGLKEQGIEDVYNKYYSILPIAATKSATALFAQVGKEKWFGLREEYESLVPVMDRLETALDKKRLTPEALEQMLDGIEEPSTVVKKLLGAGLIKHDSAGRGRYRVADIYQFALDVRK